MVVASWGPLGRPLGSLFGHLGPSWGHLGVLEIFSQLAPSWAVLGTLGASWPVLGRRPGAKLSLRGPCRDFAGDCSGYFSPRDPRRPARTSSKYSKAVTRDLSTRLARWASEFRIEPSW
eukprot:904304-Pyramimonas_sp.AAC.1